MLAFFALNRCCWVFDRRDPGCTSKLPSRGQQQPQLGDLDQRRHQQHPRRGGVPLLYLSQTGDKIQPRLKWSLFPPLVVENKLIENENGKKTDLTPVWKKTIIQPNNSQYRKAQSNLKKIEIKIALSKPLNVIALWLHNFDLGEPLWTIWIIFRDCNLTMFWFLFENSGCLLWTWIWSGVRKFSSKLFWIRSSNKSSEKMFVARKNLIGFKNDFLFYIFLMQVSRRAFMARCWPIHPGEMILWSHSIRGNSNNSFPPVSLHVTRGRKGVAKVSRDIFSYIF